jgi:hypothetical protein
MDGRVRTAIIAMVVATVGSLSGVSAADAAQFLVMNTREQPPDGVWFRYAPDPSATTRTTGLGVYQGEHVNVRCYWNGTPFGPYNNNVWYYAFDLERPTVGGASNEGWINTHYVDDGMTANNAAPGVPHCAVGSGNGGDVAASEATGGGGQVLGATTTPTAVYYSPYEDQAIYQLAAGDPTKLIRFSDWWPSHANCSKDNPRKPYNATMAAAAGQPITTIAGWSSGRLGVFGYLNKASDLQLKQLNYVVLIDPGSIGDMGCDLAVPGAGKAGNVLVRWLRANRSAHLVVISGTISQTARSEGIQEAYYNPIRNATHDYGVNLRSRALTCNYKIDHDPQAFQASRYWIQHQIGSKQASCPWLSLTGTTYKPTAGWHP